MYALDIQSTYQVEINGLTDMFRVAISIRNCGPGLIISMSQNDYVSVAVLSKIVVYKNSVTWGNTRSERMNVSA